MAAITWDLTYSSHCVWCDAKRRGIMSQFGGEGLRDEGDVQDPKMCHGLWQTESSNRSHTPRGRNRRITTSCPKINLSQSTTRREAGTSKPTAVPQGRHAWVPPMIKVGLYTYPHIVGMAPGTPLGVCTGTHMANGQKGKTRLSSTGVAPNETKMKP